MQISLRFVMLSLSIILLNLCVYSLQLTLPKLIDGQRVQQLRQSQLPRGWMPWQFLSILRYYLNPRSSCQTRDVVAARPEWNQRRGLSAKDDRCKHRVSCLRPSFCSSKQSDSSVCIENPPTCAQMVLQRQGVDFYWRMIGQIHGATKQPLRTEYKMRKGSPRNIYIATCCLKWNGLAWNCLEQEVIQVVLFSVKGKNGGVIVHGSRRFTLLLHLIVDAKNFSMVPLPYSDECIICRN